MNGKTSKVLVADDTAAIRGVLVHILSDQGWVVLEAGDGRQALDVFQRERPDAVLLDKIMPGMDGLEVLTRLRQADPDVPIIMLTAFAEVETAVRAMHLGAYDFLTKPFNNSLVVEVVRRSLEMRSLNRQVAALELRLDKDMPLAETMGSSEQINRVFSLVNRVAATTFTVFVYGETGSGKELVAHAIHRLSDRRDKAFIAVDCGSIPEALLESELFGHEKGSFTSADRLKQGQFELANGGTLFLDEIGNLPLPMQGKLLRVLQERLLQRIGSQETIPIDIRVVAASNEHLELLVEQGRFRRDLYFRLNEFVIEIPPLRERRDDVLFLCDRFIRLTNAELRKHVRGLSEEALGRVLGYHWPGNVRELRNVIRRAVLLADDLIQPHHLSGLAAGAAPDRSASPAPSLSSSLSLTEMVKLHSKEFERQIIAEALRQTEGNKSQAARLLHIDYKTLHYKTRELNL